MYNHAPENYVCPFCLLIQGIKDESVHSVRTDIIYHNDAVTAFMATNQYPNNHGNVLIAPNEHFENIFDLPLDYARDIHRALMMIATAMKIVYSCDGISTRQHNEPAGGQDVWHYHMHVTPRYPDDQFYATMGKRQLMPAIERALHAERLRNQLES
jgi:histidine triad (HIT) family protein